MRPQERRLVLWLLVMVLAACAAPMTETEKQDMAQSHYDIGLGALAENNTSRAILELKEAVES